MSKYWAVTHNVPSADAVRRLHELFGAGSILSAAYSLECGSRLHLQCFLALKQKATMAGIKKLLGSRWEVGHFEQARDPAKAHDYALKDDETTVKDAAAFARLEGHAPNWRDVHDRYISIHPIDWDFKPYRAEIGHWAPPAGAGSRTDLKAFAMAVVASAGAAEPRMAYIDSVLKHPDVFLRVSKGSELLYSYARTKLEAGGLLVRPAPRVSIFYGPPGTGKSYAAVAGRTKSDTFIMRKQGPDGRPYWDGYAGHKRIVIEEFAGWLPLPTLLGVTDTYAMMLDCRGTQVPLEATEIILTTNIWWESFYASKQWVSVHKAAFRRRVHELRHYADAAHPGTFSVLDMDGGEPGAPAAFGGAGSAPLDADPHVFDDVVIPDSPRT